MHSFLVRELCSHPLTCNETMPRFQSIVALALLCLQMTAGGQAEAAPLAVSSRIVAIGDLHSDYSQAVAVLRMANILDSDDNWAGGQDTLISTVSATQ